MDFKRLQIAGAALAGDLAGLEKDAEALVALGEVAAHWRELAQATGKATTVADAESLIRALISDIQSDAVKEGFATLGLTKTHATLTAQLAKVTKILDSIPDKVRWMIRPVSDFAPDAATIGTGKISWTPLDQSATVIDHARHSLSLSANAGLSIEAGLAWPYSGDSKSGRLMRIGVEGAAGANGKGQWPVGAFALAAKGSTSVKLNLDYYFDETNPVQPYALAIGDNLADLADPFDFDALWDAMASSALYGVDYHYEGAADIAVSVAIGVEDEILSGVDLTANAKIGVTAKRSGKFALSVRKATGPTGQQALIIAQSSTNGSVRAVTIGADISIDLSGLAAVLHDKLKPLVDKWDAALKDARPFLSPGTYLKSALGNELQAAADRLVKDATLRKALVSDLRGAVGFDPADESALAKWLAGEISGAANRQVAAATGKAEAGAAALRNALSEIIPAAALPAVQPVIDAELGKLVTLLSTKLAAAATSLVSGDKLVKPLDDLLKALNVKSAGVNDALSAADKALAGVRAVIDKYDALLHKMLKATEDEARAKVSARLQMDYRREQGSAITIKGKMLQKSAANASLFAAIRRGDSRHIAKLLTGEASADFVIDPESQLSWTSGRSAAVSGGLILFGFGGTFESLVSGSAKMVLDANGVLRVDAKGEYAESVKFNKESSKASLVASAALVGAKMQQKEPAQDATKIEFGVTVQTDDQSLSRPELVKYCNSLSAGGLIDTSVTQNALKWLDEWDGPGNDRQVHVQLLAKLWLSPAQLRQLLRLDQRPDGTHLSPAALRAIGLQAAEALEQSRALNGPEIQRHLQTVAANLVPPQPVVVRELIDRTWDSKDWQRLNKNVHHGSGPLAHFINGFVHLRTMVQGVAEMIDHMGQIYLSTPKLPGAAGPGWTITDYDAASFSIAKLAVPWVKTNPAIGEVYGDVNARTVALLGLMCDLSGATPAEALRIVMTRQAAEAKDAVTVVLMEGGAVPD